MAKANNTNSITLKMVDFNKMVNESYKWYWAKKNSNVKLELNDDKIIVTLTSRYDKAGEPIHGKFLKESFCVELTK